MMLQETIEAARRGYLEKKIKQLNRRCDKLGIEPLVVEFSNQYVKDSGYGEKRLMMDAVITGEEPKIEGWEPIAVFQLENGAVLIREFPDRSVPVELRPEEIRCEHCNAKRHRKSSILMRSTEDGTYKEVGTTCVKDFIGHDPAAWLFWATFKEDIEDEIDRMHNRSVSKESLAHNLIPFLHVAAAVVRTKGWTSKKKVKEVAADNPDTGLRSTSSHTLEQIAYKENPSIEVSRNFEPVEILDEDRATATAAIEYIRTRATAEPENNYFYNALQVIELGYVPSYQVGLATSIIGMYQIELRKDAERKIKEEEAEGKSEWVGEPKERMRFYAWSAGHSNFDSEWGPKSVFVFKDADGNIFKWFTTTSHEFEKDEKVMLTGTVKNHDEWKGIKYTVLTRCIVKKEPDNG